MPRKHNVIHAINSQLHPHLFVIPVRTFSEKYDKIMNKFMLERVDKVLRLAHPTQYIAHFLIRSHLRKILSVETEF